jgi:hypothetical protein
MDEDEENDEEELELINELIQDEIASGGEFS